MGKRIRLGLIFSVNENWIGGTYYILNLISALGTLPDEKQPLITILSKNRSDLDAAKKTGYPFLKYHNPFDCKRNLAEAFANKIFRLIFKKNLIDKRISSNKIDVLFPAGNDLFFERIQNKVFWFPDFQHIVFPDFFTKNELETRNHFVCEIAGSSQNLVLSSQAAKSDWEKIPLEKKCSVDVIPFAVTHPSISEISIDELRKEFQIAKDYFIISNQFWKHKNHFVVLHAARILQEQGFPCQFVFTGKEDDYRNPGYFKSILDFIDLHHLQGYIKMLGLIDRSKQLKLMQHSNAVIQPSLFEGWSTVVEDAKSLGKIIIASDIPVHREQLTSGAYFFNPQNENDLIDKIKMVMSSEKAFVAINYQLNVAQFGELFLKTIEKFK